MKRKERNRMGELVVHLVKAVKKMHAKEPIGTLPNIQLVARKLSFLSIMQKISHQDSKNKFRNK